ncbi:MAG: D-alanine--D-alanine ligase [Gemmatimonadaceae bacterium]|nr:D-alanine--D-alanine ligase [Gemmatimonadaceae bacterium]
MKIGVLFDGMSALGKNPDVLILESVEAVENAIEDWGHAHVRIPVNPDGRWVERVRRARFDLVFNLCEGIDGVAAFEPRVISVLELFGVPYSGSSSTATSLCLRKDVVNAVLDRAGLPVPRWTLARKGDDISSVGFPAICKPAAEDASIGIEQRSVVRSGRALVARVEAMQERWDEILIQRYVVGREVNVGIVGDTVMPVAEINFAQMPRGMWKIVSYQSKWITGSEEDLGAKPSCPADLPLTLTRELQGIALAAWRAVEGKGYGRVDFRIDSSGRPWLLEVNPNPDLSPGAGLARMAGVAGMDYNALIRRICEAALAQPVEATAQLWIRSLHLSGMERLLAAAPL